jgi:hypothetical protein
MILADVRGSYGGKLGPVDHDFIGEHIESKSHL